MIQNADRGVRDWAAGVLPGVEVALGPPAEPGSSARASLHLAELADGPGIRTEHGKPPPVQIELRYLVTTAAPAPEEAHDLLGRLLVAAVERTEYQVDLTPPPGAMWTALGVAPRPAFTLRVPLVVERQAPRAKTVREVRLSAGPSRSLRGVVLGPGGQPVAAASVELPALGLHATTDRRGRFAFGRVPSGPGARRAVVRARGKQTSVQLGDSPGPDDTWHIHFEALED